MQGKGIMDWYEHKEIGKELDCYYKSIHWCTSQIISSRDGDKGE